MEFKSKPEAFQRWVVVTAISITLKKITQNPEAFSSRSYYRTELNNEFHLTSS